MSGTRVRPALAITCGDPCGIGPEIVLKALHQPRVQKACIPLVVGDEAWLRGVSRELKLEWPFARTVRDPRELQPIDRPQLLDLQNVERQLRPGQIAAAAGRAAGEAIEAAVALAGSGAAQAVATAPLHKESLAAAGYTDPGHTEMLQRLTDAPEVGMVFWSTKLSVALLSTHLALKDAMRVITATRIERKLRFLDAEWQRWFGARPRIAIAALNPHAGEGGRFGLEEIRQIGPGIEGARRRGLAVAGPFPADTVFQRVRDGEFDVVLAMYHDQGTIPVKLLCGYDAVNVTLGLPFMRTSPDHGTAMEIAGRGVASEQGMVQALLVAARFAARPRRA